MWTRSAAGGGRPRTRGARAPYRGERGARMLGATAEIAPTIRLRQPRHRGRAVTSRSASRHASSNASSTLPGSDHRRRTRAHLAILPAIEPGDAPARPASSNERCPSPRTSSACAAGRRRNARPRRAAERRDLPREPRARLDVDVELSAATAPSNTIVSCGSHSSTPRATAGALLRRAGPRSCRLRGPGRREQRVRPSRDTDVDRIAAGDAAGRMHDDRVTDGRAFRIERRAARRSGPRCRPRGKTRASGAASNATSSAPCHAALGGVQHGRQRGVHAVAACPPRCAQPVMRRSSTAKSSYIAIAMTPMTRGRRTPAASSSTSPPTSSGSRCPRSTRPSRTRPCR